MQSLQLLAFLVLLIQLPHSGKAGHIIYGLTTWKRMKDEYYNLTDNHVMIRFRSVAAIAGALGIAPGTPFTLLSTFGEFGDGGQFVLDGSLCSVLRNDQGIDYQFVLCTYFHEYDRNPGLYTWKFPRGENRQVSQWNNPTAKFQYDCTVITSDFYRQSIISAWLPYAYVPYFYLNDFAEVIVVGFDPYEFQVVWQGGSSQQMCGDSLCRRPPVDQNSWKIDPLTGNNQHTNLSAEMEARSTSNLNNFPYMNQILISHFDSNRTIAIDSLYYIVPYYTFCGGSPPCSGKAWERCVHNNDCDIFDNVTNITTPGFCGVPEAPQFLIPPSPEHGSVVTIFATQTSVFQMMSNLTGHLTDDPCVEIFYEEGVFPVGFGDVTQGLRVETKGKPYNVDYTWTPTLDQDGLHAVCFAACTIEPDPVNCPRCPGSPDKQCSRPHCYAIFVSLYRNQPPVITLPQVTKTEFGMLAEHKTWRYITDLTVDDDSGDNDVEVIVTVDHGIFELGHFPPGLEFLNGTNGTLTNYVRMFGTLEEINYALYKMKYYGEEGIDLVKVFINDKGHSGIGVGEPWTDLTDYKEFIITILPACNAPCPTEKAVLVLLYEELAGDMWYRNDNWMTGDPCWDKWHGVHCSNKGHIVTLSLPENNLEGKLPCELGCLTHLQEMWLMNNKIQGILPKKFGDLSCLYHMGLGYNQISWTIPSELQTMRDLRFFQVHNNDLIGTVPSELGNLPSAEQLLLHSNNLCGTAPAELWNLDLYYNWLHENPNLAYVPPSWSIDRFYLESELARTGSENRM